MLNRFELFTVHSLWFSIHFHERVPIHNKSRDGTRQYLRVYGNPGFWAPLLHRPGCWLWERCSLGQTRFARYGKLAHACWRRVSFSRSSQPFTTVVFLIRFILTSLTQ